MGRQVLPLCEGAVDSSDQLDGPVGGKIPSKQECPRYNTKLHLVVWFYGISTILGYLMPNQFYTYKPYYFRQYSWA